MHVCRSVDINELFRSSTQVSLKAREVLISCQMPSYEERRAQMEAILKASTTNSYYGEPGSVARYVKVNPCIASFILIEWFKDTVDGRPEGTRRLEVHGL